MSLKEYTRKRNFKETSEPSAESKSKGIRTGNRFVIQKHDASRLHYDFRLELDGTLKSWAVPKGLPYAKGEKRLAVHVEDHPVAYIDFEGTIPKGQYGGGTVMVWDQGTFEPLSEEPLKELAAGKLHFILKGEKLKGEWYLVRLKESDQWLIIKGGTPMKPVSKKLDDTSVASGKTMKELSLGDRIWQSKETHPSAVRPKAPAKTKSKPKTSGRIPAFVEPMKAKLRNDPPAGKWQYEIKFDGWRALALKGGSQSRLLSRNEKDFGAKFPEIMDSISALDADDAIIDGEIVALDEKGRSSFQLLQAYDISDERPPICFYAFDLLQLNGKKLHQLPLQERKQLLAELLEKPPGVMRYSASLGSDAEELLKQAGKLGLEGLIGKKENSLYEVGQRSGSWIKLKLLKEQEFVIGGYTEPEGTREYFGSLIVGVFDKGKLVCTGKVGSGFNHNLLRSLHSQFKKVAAKTCPFSNLPDTQKGKWGQGITKSVMESCHWLKPVFVGQVRYTEWTRDNRLRHPVFQGLRVDKTAKDVHREKAV